ncbi:alpha/beta hydrolase fold domain-containing protein [Protaetiibacter intestinalis]|uniref:Alpha/beta hydrolase n=1 Tax=Protaetiibacter intestinalis TaxID=2419774 RepID=A0A387BE03_9MICO|nr:alpha/beta hydrolase fold domain-containing protein [Protaetiibacter intestinalis]AYF99286.1 alpha/beta hydrolase [Protaetiibacter intestinalis]
MTTVVPLANEPQFDPQLAELLPALKGFVPVGMTMEQLEYFRGMPQPSIEEQINGRPVTSVDHTIRGYNGDEIVVSVISREDHQEARGGVLGIHGGGMVMCNRFASAYPLIDWAMELDIVSVTVEYRLAPEHPYPYGVEDCYAALEWMHANATELRIDPEKLVVFGGSGGGGLAAGTTLLARDRKGPKLRGQLLQCPMIDDRNETLSAHQFDNVGVWDRTSNITAWDAILAGSRGQEDVSMYAAPARSKDLSGLPPTFIDVGGAEVFRDEAIAYATGILNAGGEAELHVWGAAFHGFYDIAPNSAVARSCIAARDQWISRILSR